MHDILLKAKYILNSASNTCVVINSNSTWSSTLNGIKPLIELYESDFDTNEAYIADIIVGKAAALMYVLMNVKYVYARIISKSAVLVLKKYNIYYEYDNLVDYIINRENNGICPMEQVTFYIDDPYKAYDSIKRKLIELEGI